VLEIDGRPVPWEELACWLVRFQGEQHVADFVKRKTLERAAAAAGVGVTEAELRALAEAQVEARVEQAFGGDRAAWLAELERLGSDVEADLAQRVQRARADVLVERLVQARRVVDEAALRAAWERQYGPGGRSLDLALIHLRVPPAPPEASRTRDEALEAQRVLREKTRAEAAALREELLAGADFAELARERSAHESSARGGRVGDLREVTGWRQVLPQLEGLAVGDVSEPIFARGGWNLFRVEGETITPFASVAEELREELATAPPNAEEVAALVDELTGEVTVELLPELDRVVAGRGSEPQSWRLDRPVLLIDGQPVTRGEYAAWLVPSRGPALVRAFAQESIVERLAADEGIAVSSAELDARLREEVAHRIEDLFEGDREAWRADITSRGLSEAGYLRALSTRLREDMLAERLLVARREVTDEMVRREWERRYGAGGRSPDVRWIQLDYRQPADGEVTTPEELERHLEAERARARAALESLRERVANGEDFATLAKLYSEDPATRDRGGRPAVRFEPQTVPAEVREAVAALEPGGTTPPIEQGYSMRVFQLVGVVEVPLAEVADALRAELEARRPSMIEVAAFENELYQEHEVRTLPGLYGS
jgi:parvulin-like peptidyl-prolyl isomerase